MSHSADDVAALELERNRVSVADIPGWKLDAAAWGIRFVVSKMFGGIRHPSGNRLGPVVKWFAGERAKVAAGVVRAYDPNTIWISAKLASWEQVIKTAAHETVHTYSYTEAEHYYDHELPTLAGGLAVADYTRERVVFVKWGPLPHAWMPDDETELPARAVLLHFEDGEHNTLINVGRPNRPDWERRSLGL